ncbi:MAG: hypothetical protein HC780_28910 [Leptolyngbyaceae cyanobacterium CSU_1_3]|nr:hypothetical protein [Leptolyngbyaceae cyanobacterium CSU_1_3]
MKRFLSHRLSILFLAASTTAISLPAFSTPLPRTLTATGSAMNSTAFMVKSPTITSSAVLGEHHVIRLAVAKNGLKNLMIALPRQMAGYTNIQVTDQTGKEIPSEISVNNRQVAIVFKQVVMPGSSLEIDFSGVPSKLDGGESLEYGISAEQEGLMGQIPVGTARVQTPFKS